MNTESLIGRLSAPPSRHNRLARFLALATALASLILGGIGSSNPTILLVSVGILAFLLLIVFTMPLETGFLPLGLAITPFQEVVVFETPFADIRMSQIVWTVVFIAILIQDIDSRKKRDVTDEKRLPARLKFSILAWFIVELILIPTSRNVTLSIREYVQTSYFLILFITVVSKCQTERQFQIALKILFGTAFITVILGAITVLLGYSPIPMIWIDVSDLNVEVSWSAIKMQDGVRWYILGLGPVATGFYLVSILLVVIGYLVDGTRRSRGWLVCFSILALGMIVFSGSRASMIGLFLGIFLLFLVQRRWKLIALIPVMVLVVMAFTAINPVMNNRLASLLDLGQDATSQFRISLWLAGWEMFKSRPLTGVGVSGFSLSEEVYIAGRYIDTSPNAHNFLVQAAAETGILGLGAICWFLYECLRLLFRASRFPHSCRSTQSKVFLTAVVSGLAMCLTLNSFRTDLFWMLLGVAVASALRVPSDACWNKSLESRQST